MRFPRHVSFIQICDCHIFRILPHFYHISAKCAYRIFFPHKLAFSTTILIFSVFGCQQIDNMQFGFMKGKGTTDAIFMARQMQENFRVKGKKLRFRFVDLEKDLIGCLEKE